MLFIELLKQAEGILAAVGVEEARVNADLLLAHILKIPRDRLYLEQDRTIEREEEREFWRLVGRRRERVPLAYLTGCKEFMSLEFLVSPAVLIPRPETEMLVEHVLAAEGRSTRAGLRIWDLCTGSGAIAVSLAKYLPSAEIVASDIDGVALEIAASNIRRHHVVVELRQGDFLEAANNEKFRWIVSNPPYVAQAEYEVCSPEVKQEPLLALLGAENGLYYYRVLAEKAAGYLTEDGVLLMEIGSTQGAAIKELFERRGWSLQLFRDLAGLERMAKAQRRI